MHETSLAAGVVALAEEAAARERFTRVKRIRISIGRLAGVELPALRFALESMAPGTCLEGAEWVFDELDARASCPGCGRSVVIASRFDPCPACGSFGLRPTEGTGLRVADLLVEDEAAPPAARTG